MNNTNYAFKCGALEAFIKSLPYCYISGAINDKEWDTFCKYIQSNLDNIEELTKQYSEEVGT